MNDIKLWAIFTKVRSSMKKVQQLSFTIAKTEERYPALESMSSEDLESLTRVYLALGSDLEMATKEYKEAYKEYKAAKDGDSSNNGNIE